ncbi:MAG: hypothetical protein L6Q68_18515 [Aquabacterium sp.]|nr:hypothetical protein [Aquabacterium sp.]
MKPTTAPPSASVASAKPAKLSSERGLLILIAAYTVVSFLCTFTALNTNSAVESVYAVTTRMFPTIPGLAYYSGKTNETTLYYSIYLVTLPFVVAVFNWKIEVARPVRPPPRQILKLLLVIVGSVAFAALIVFCLAFLRINTASGLTITGGRGDALFMGLTGRWPFRGGTSAVACYALCFQVFLTIHGTKALIRRIKHV